MLVYNLICMDCTTSVLGYNLICMDCIFFNARIQFNPHGLYFFSARIQIKMSLVGAVVLDVDNIFYAHTVNLPLKPTK